MTNLSLLDTLTIALPSFLPAFLYGLLSAISAFLIFLAMKNRKETALARQELREAEAEIAKRRAETEEVAKELEKSNKKLAQTEAIMRKALEKAKEKEKEVSIKNEELSATESELRMILEETLSMQEVLITQKQELDTTNAALSEKETVLKKALEDARESAQELQSINEELHQTQDTLLAQKEQLETNNGLLHEYNSKISKSIAAAKLIQKAILPPKAKMAALFGEHFVLFKPRDVVSGDFWWADEIEGQKFLIVADCTGHGVPGALLTMIGSSLLDKIIKLMGIRSPGDILENLNAEVNALLRQDETNSNEGMDIAIATWQAGGEMCRISFGAAKRPLYYSCDGQTDKLPGSRKDIGGQVRQALPFETQCLILPKGSCLYLCSDGYQDQNNAQMRGFSGKRLLALFQEINPLPMISQKELVNERLARHMEGTEQRDDILMIGVRV